VSAEGIARGLERMVETHDDVDPDDVLETELRLVRSPSGRAGIAYSATLAIPTDEFVVYRDEEIIPEVDRRRCPRGGRRNRGASVTIGTMKYTSEGEMLDHHIQPEYRVPSARGEDA